MLMKILLDLAGLSMISNILLLRRTQDDFNMEHFQFLRLLQPNLDLKWYERSEFKKFENEISLYADIS